MKFRPCIDIHDGKVKQIVGGSLNDETGADTNFVSEHGAGYFGRLYRTCNVSGGHIILLNKPGTKEYLEDIRAASEAMKEFPGGFMIGGGVTIENAQEYLKLYQKAIEGKKQEKASEPDVPNPVVVDI